MTTTGFKALEALASKKESIRQREQKMVAGLRDTLGRLGYGLEQIGGNGVARGGSHAARGRSLRPGGKPLTCPECARPSLFLSTSAGT